MFTTTRPLVKEGTLKQQGQEVMPATASQQVPLPDRQDKEMLPTIVICWRADWTVLRCILHYRGSRDKLHRCEFYIS